MGNFNPPVFMSVVVASFVLTSLYDHFASRGADAVKAVKIKATALLVNFYAVGFALLWMTPSTFELDPLRYGTEVKTVEQLVPLLKQQARALADFREPLHWFLFFSVLGFAPALRGLFGKAVVAAAGRGGSDAR